jgi:hypothetical protein
MSAPVTDVREWLELAAAWLDHEIDQAIADHVEDYGPDTTDGQRTLVWLVREERIKKLPEGLRHVASLIRPAEKP